MERVCRLINSLSGQSGRRKVAATGTNLPTIIALPSPRIRHTYLYENFEDGYHIVTCKNCNYEELEEHHDTDSDGFCDECEAQIGLPYKHKSIDDLVANPPTDTEIYIVEGIWQHKGDSGSLADDVYGNGYLYDPISGNRIEHYGMVENEEAFKKAYDSSANKFTNPKTFKSTKTQFNEGDQIQLGVVYNSTYHNYYSFFIKRTEVKANIYYSATTDFNNEGGTVTIDNANALIYGQSVEINITVTDGYKVNSVKHNGTSITENGGKYTFTVVPGPNKISVEFVEDTGEPEVPLVAKYTFTNATDSKGNSSYTGSYEKNFNGIKWHAEANVTTNPWRFGFKEAGSGKRSLYTMTAMNYDIKKIEITFGTSTLTVNSASLIVSKNSDFSNADTVSFDFNADNTVTIEIPQGKDWNNSYFKFLFDVTATGKQYFTITKVVFYAP